MFFLAAGNSEETFWIQLLVVVILACAAGVYTLVKSRAKRFRRHTEDTIIETLIESPAASPSAFKKQSFNISTISSPALRSPAGEALRSPADEAGVSANSAVKKQVQTAPTRFEFPVSVQKKRATATGMELLTMEFLVEVVERVKAVEKADIAMRSMCWKELIRRGELGEVSSESLKTYILNEGGLFDKSIRLQAMAELAGRTE